MIFGQDLVKKGEIVFPQGTGPRHGVVSGDEKYLYLVSELSNEFFVIEAGTWQILQAIPVLSDGRMHVEGGAAVRLSEDEHHAYVSTREQEVLSVIDLADGHASLVQNTDCGGRHPRDFICVDSHLLVANRFTNTVVSFALKEDGTIGEKIGEIPVPEAVALLAVR